LNDGRFAPESPALVQVELSARHIYDEGAHVTQPEKLVSISLERRAIRSDI